MILSKENNAKGEFGLFTEGGLKASQLKEYLLVVPTNRKLRDLKKEIIAGYKGLGITSLNLETLESLCGRLLSSGKMYIPLEEAPASVLLSQAVEETELRYFASYKGDIPKGTMSRIKSVISEYKRHGISPDRLRGETEGLPYSEQLKIIDIAGIFENYKKKTDALKAYEAGDVYAELVDLAENDFNSSFKVCFPEVKEIYINGFDEFSTLELKILDRLSLIEGIKLFLRFDYYAGNPELFSHLDKCYNSLESFGFTGTAAKKNKTNGGFNGILKEKLFSETAGARNKKYKENIFKISSFNREEEVINIAKEVKQLILKEYADPSRICVAFNLVQNYSPVVNEVFSIYGIPVNLTDRVFLEYTSPIITLINLLEILENDYYYKNVIRAFSSNIIKKDGIDLRSIISSAVNLKIIGGRENWISVLRNAVDKRTRYAYETESGSGIEEAELYTAALESIKKIRDILKPFEEKMSIGEFIGRLEQMVYNLDMPNLILEQSAEKEKELKALTTFLETTDEVFNLLAPQYGDEKKFGISFFLDQLRTSATYARFNVKEKSDSSVLVTSIEEIRGLDFDYLFIGGLCDGDFPTRYQPEIFFTKSFQKQEEIHLKEERYRFYQGLSVWKKRLYLSVPLNEGGKELNESSFLKEFSRLFETTFLDKDYFAGKIYSAEEVLKIIGSVNDEVKSGVIIPELEKEGFDKEYFYKALEVQLIRLNSQGDSPYCGYVNYGLDLLPEEWKDKIRDRFDIIKNKQYSISQLETYAKCPFKFFTERILSVREEKEPSDEIEAIEMGNLLHSIFFEFFTWLRNEGIKLHSCSEDLFSSAVKKIFEIAEAEISSMPFSSPLSFYEREKILGIEGKQINSILFKLIKYERENYDGYEPSYFEMPFGNVDREKSESELGSESSVSMNGVKLKGKIDRIEINKDDKHLRIVDYKLSGKKPTREELQRGLSLQLPVYLAAAEQIIFEKFEEKLVPAEMVIYSLKYNADDLKKDKVRLGSKKADDEIALTSELLETTRNYIAEYAAYIGKGIFPLSPHPERDKIVCQYCGLKAICRVSDLF